MPYVLIDESGRVTDPGDRILVLVALITENLSELEKIIIRARRRIPTKGKRRKERLSELKFSLTGDNTRLFVLKELAKQKVSVYSLVIDKGGRKITDDPSNYALLIGKVLKLSLSDHPRLTHILIDRHFTFITQREAFNLNLQRRFGSSLFIEHVDSLQNPVITLVDFVAGAFRIAYTKQNTQFLECIKDLVVIEKKVTWREIKSGKP